MGGRQSRERPRSPPLTPETVCGRGYRGVVVNRQGTRTGLDQKFPGMMVGGFNATWVKDGTDPADIAGWDAPLRGAEIVAAGPLPHLYVENQAALMAAHRLLWAAPIVAALRDAIEHDFPPRPESRGIEITEQEISDRLDWEAMRFLTSFDGAGGIANVAGRFVIPLEKVPAEVAAQLEEIIARTD